MNKKNIAGILVLFLIVDQASAMGQLIGGGGNGGSSYPVPDSPDEDSSSSSSSVPPIPSGASSTELVNQILTIANNSSCASISWSSRGRAPKGYIKGMALTYARSLCRSDDPRTDIRTPATLMSRAQTGNTSSDALAYLKSTIERAGLNASRSGDDTLRALYTLGIGLGMRESSGKHCEGWDISAGAYRSSSEAEAGLFQTSYNSMAASSELTKLYAEYKANKNRCMLSTFKEGVSCTSRSILGTGEGATFQKLAKDCPAFAAEYAMVNLRVLRKHYGPINRREAEVKSSCGNMLDQVESYVLANKSKVCAAVN